MSYNMTPRERDEAIQKGRIPDRFPAIPFMGELKCEISGVSARAFWEDEEAMVKTECMAYHRFGYDRVVIGPNTNGFSEALGLELIFRGQEPPRRSVPIVRAAEDLDLLPSGEEVIQRLLRFQNAASALVSEIGNEVPIEMSLGGPFTIASGLRGIEQLLMDVRKNPEFVHRLMRTVVDVQKQYVDAVAGLGVGTAMADPVASPVLIGPKTYERFVYPYTLELTRYIKETIGRGTSLHMCGKTYSIWKFIKEYPLQEISLDNIVDLRRAADELGDYVPIAGNVDPVNVMHYGTPAEVREAVKNCIDAGKHAKCGFHLATGCDIATGTPFENIDAFMSAAEEYGKTMTV